MSGILVQFRDAGVSLMRFTYLLVMMASMFWFTPMALYVYGAYHAMDVDNPFAVRAVWASDAAVHVVVGLLVAWDACCVGGVWWPLQTLVIGGATYITLTLPALAGYYLVDEDPTGTAVSLSALACGCLADGAMVAMLFEYFHRRVGTRPRPAVLATTSSSAPSRAGVVGAERAAASGRR